MHYYLKKYDHIIIDFSAMFVRLDPILTAQLASCDSILFAPTASSECHHFSATVPPRLKTIYQENLKPLRYSEENICWLYGTVDTFGLAKALCVKGQQVLVVEANLALEDRLVFSSLTLDVYSWDKERLLTPGDFLAERRQRMLCKDKDPLPYHQLPSGSAVYSGFGRHFFSPGTSSHEGAEAQVYRLERDPQHLAKLFKLDNDDRNVLTKQKLQNIEDLLDLGEDWDVDWLALPKAVLYADLGKSKPVGYLMERVRGRFLSEDPLFAVGDPSKRFAEDPDLRIRDVLELCIRFVSQYQFLAANGISLTDYNYKNFALEKLGNQKRINMVDTDSFSYDDYLSKCITYGSCFSRKYTANTKYDLTCISDESLYIFIFTILVLDQEYKPLFNGGFRFSQQKLHEYTAQNKQIHLIKWKSIPENLQRLYSDVFARKHIPSVGILLHELDAARQKEFAQTRYTDLYAPLIARATASKTPPPEKRPNINAGSLSSSTGTQATTTTPNTKTATSTPTISATQTTFPDAPKPVNRKMSAGSFFKGLIVGVIIVQLILGTVCYFNDPSTVNEAGLFGYVEHIFYCFFNHTIPGIVELLSQLLDFIST